MKKYKCPECGKVSTTERIDSHILKLLVDYYITSHPQFLFKDIEEDSNIPYYCPHCNKKLVKKDFEVIEK